jgi:hypothetical protein
MEKTALARRLLELHEERVGVYRRLEECFRTYLLDEQEHVFGLAVQGCTADFVRISQAVLASSAEGPEDLKAVAKRWQLAEKEKLGATVRLQALQKAHYIDAARKDREEEKMRHAEREGTNVLHPHTHSHADVPETLADKRIPPFDEVYNKNAGEAARTIASCVAEINECVEELREMAGEY